ncbi:hypothetical protein PtrSN002B_005669 [Pyrenophora tritici-repentis]|uniref:Uncharacterized protein n=2 Tax=Pyrenophora tritici-repentis TaxID=45151 RepID=A0A2W1FMV2_9PLEO|nr:uncharacterized protein PTRG_01062 [Pyrenophora tritici-repentis Pt-1C-BFP]KAA8625695.1 hypothetical protein PtrV1_01375 [Pyrenophora tritici-repentis]EDU40500.1 conserved hypothetical protein [Pyrenophora tritici-repentis Pt-1C-BFP]KAF7454112.1 hypothetical protein A1F99_013700 [Pyrenophora tritici-repentis]KAF7577202.1 hypothetical protein PtrM4_014420 [Pyrenophora tritici-repentis]KAG9387860.1 hypothetical protein A1F94_000752 [Pyrenophora tritici-repentis]
MDNRAIRLPPTARRNLFATAQQQQQQTSRRQNGTAPSIRPDSREVEPDIFQQPAEDELVERDDQGEYVIHAPDPVYGNNKDAEPEDNDEAEQENELIEMYVNGKPDAHWDTDAVEEEVRAALKNSLRKKVASLEDDKWMFEAETEVKK